MVRSKCGSSEKKIRFFHFFFLRNSFAERFHRVWRGRRKKSGRSHQSGRGRGHDWPRGGATNGATNQKKGHDFFRFFPTGPFVLSSSFLLGPLPFDKGPTALGAPQSSVGGRRRRISLSLSLTPSPPTPSDHVTCFFTCACCCFLRNEWRRRAHGATAATLSSSTATTRAATRRVFLQKKPPRPAFNGRPARRFTHARARNVLGKSSVMMPSFLGCCQKELDNTRVLELLRRNGRAPTNCSNIWCNFGKTFVVVGLGGGESLEQTQRRETGTVGTRSGEPCLDNVALEPNGLFFFLVSFDFVRLFLRRLRVSGCVRAANAGPANQKTQYPVRLGKTRLKPSKTQ